MNCSDVIAFVLEPGLPPVEVREHLERCGACGAQAEESRRVAALIADLPMGECPDIAGRVMAQIGFGNGRPTRDKIADQLRAVRSELECVEPWADDRTLAHIAEEESRTLLAAAKSSGRADLKAFTNGQPSATTQGELRRVRERTLRLISGLSDADLGVAGAEALRSIYRHEAEHASRLADAAWREARHRALSR